MTRSATISALLSAGRDRVRDAARLHAIDLAGKRLADLSDADLGTLYAECCVVPPLTEPDASASFPAQVASEASNPAPASAPAPSSSSSSPAASLRVTDGSSRGGLVPPPSHVRPDLSVPSTASGDGDLFRPEPGVKPVPAGCGGATSPSGDTNRGDAESPLDAPSRAPVLDPGPWAGMCATFTRAGAIEFVVRTPDELGRVLARRGLDFTTFRTVAPRVLLAIAREVLNEVAPGSLPTMPDENARPAPKRPRAVTSLAGIQSSKSETANV